MKTTPQRANTASDSLSLQRSAKKFRILTASLMISGALNIGFIAVSISSLFQEQQSHLSIRPFVKGKSVPEASLERFFTPFAKLSFQELVPYLTNCDALVDGYLKRDLALATLVAYHHFNIEKAISGVCLQRRQVHLGTGEQLEMFPGLNSEHFEAIIRFAYEEKWPLTTDGLYKLLKKRPDSKDPSLVQAFLITPEFHSLQTLFQRIDPETLLSLVSEGSFDLLDRFAKEQEQLLDLSQERRRTLLLSYLAAQSKTAAYLLLNSDFSFVAKKLEDKGILSVLSLLEERTEESERLCRELLKSPRSDAVWKGAVSLLYRYFGQVVPDSIDLQEAIRLLTQAEAPASFEELSLEPSALKQHVVKDGESLWKISRLYSVKVEDIIHLNNLEKDRLYPGMTLRIP